MKSNRLTADDIYHVRRAVCTDRPNGKTTVYGRCIFTGIEYEFEVETAELRAWQNGQSIQYAMPSANADKREFLLSGIAPQGWDKYIKSDKED